MKHKITLAVSKYTAHISITDGQTVIEGVWPLWRIPEILEQFALTGKLEIGNKMYNLSTDKIAKAGVLEFLEFKLQDYLCGK